ncbi:MAG: phosphatase PAP2 family protein [Clostridia bacterium]|nr:phosphatase PAP2 family protein [Clostridia bacterium]
MFDALNNFEIPILDAIQSIRCGFLDALLPVITAFADHGIGWIIVAAVLLFFKKTRKTGLMAGVALIIGLLVVNMTMKPLFARIRPYEVNEAIKAFLLVEPLADFSFPSGHTLASFEVATVLMIRDRKFGIPALILAFVIAFSRLYLYVHYPTDVIVGLLLGVLFGFLGVLIVNKTADLIDKKRKVR